ncbi:MAG: hypothetical protein WC314_04945 [Vulcanimicrobiota bacterium]
MTEDKDYEAPYLQRLLERPFLLLGIGMGVMLLFYTGWGLVELALLPQAALP